jgi:dienelactone hydrolase
MAPSRFRWLVAATALVLFAALIIGPGWRHARAMGVMARFADREGLWKELGRHTVVETAFDLEDGVHARLYVPSGVAHPAGMVLAHGVHRLGIDEPRLVRFSRAIASAGVVVLTPELRELADFRIEPHSIATLGAAVRNLRAKVGGRPVGLLGMSFAGGLALVAAADETYAPDIAFVVSIGGHDDLERVLRFFVTGEIERPDGILEKLTAHEYGPLVVAYSHIESFFPPEDVAVARESLRLWLWERFDDARKRAQGLGPSSRQRMESLFAHRLDTIAPELLAEIERNKAELPRVSPSSCLSKVHVPVYLLHGAGDTVIPAVEALWLAHHTPQALLAETLVSSAISHVELRGQPGWRAELALVHFVARMLAQAESTAW